MYEQINPTQTFRERQLALLEEADNGRIGGRLCAGRSSHRARSGMAAFILATLMVGGLMLVALSSPAHSSTTFTVNLPGDTHDASLADGLCDVNLFGSGEQCTLRAAIEQANATIGADAISFNIPDVFGAGVKTINVGSTGNAGLPPITDQVTIDGYTQPGASPNTLAVGDDATLKIELNGTSAPGATGLDLSDSSGSVIKGLVINRFFDGISIHGDSVGNRIEGNFVGTDPTGTLERGNAIHGLFITGGASETVVGGTAPAARNLISANTEHGLFISGSSGNKVLGNRIGTDKSGTKDLGNGLRGVFITIGLDNSVGDGTSAGSNTIAFNGDDGVNVDTGTGNAISRNSIFSNAALGIDLSGGFENAANTTANDPGDIDNGSNGLQNFPVISSAKRVSGKTTIKGKLASTPSIGMQRNFVIQFFSNPSGNEGKRFIGQKSVTTDASGNVSFTKALPKVAVGKTITATATGSEGTSEFSAPRKVRSS
jgi:hypothetical protein